MAIWGERSTYYVVIHTRAPARISGGADSSNRHRIAAAVSDHTRNAEYDGCEESKSRGSHGGQLRVVRLLVLVGIDMSSGPRKSSVCEEEDQSSVWVLLYIY